MDQTILLGFRQYLHSEKSWHDLREIIVGAREYVPAGDGFRVMIALCGDHPREFLEQNGLLDQVAFYDFAPWEESAQRVAEVYQRSYFKPERVQLVHYHTGPLGLTYPLEFLVHVANRMQARHLAVSDSDFQMSWSEIRRSLDYHNSNADPDEKVITYPRRRRRSLDANKYPINRWAMEDLENLYIYLLSDLKVLQHKPDFQSGLSITSRAANAQLNFDRVGSWIGNLHTAIQVIRHKGRLENDLVVDTNLQNESTINFDVQCAKIEQLYHYYMIPISNIIHLALQHPDHYLMEDWTTGKSFDEIKESIYTIEELYNKYLQKN